jgi:hypothetical protein
VRYRYQWQRCARICVAIKGATKAKFRIVAADRGASLRLQVTASNSTGTTQAVSSGLGPVATIAQLRSRLAAILAGAKRARIKALLTHGGYPFVLVAPSTGRLAISFSTVATRHSKSVVIANLRTVLRAVGRTPLEVTLTPRGRRLLHKGKALDLAASVTFTPSHYHAITARASFSLKR